MSRIKVFLILLLITGLFGCSSSNNSVVPGTTPGSGNLNTSGYDSLPVFVSDSDSQGNPAEGYGIMGLFGLVISDKNASLLPLRKSALEDVLEVVDITNFLSLAPCTDCVEIASVELDIDENVVVSIGIKHPFGPGDPLKPITGQNRADLHVFNVEGIVLSNAAGTPYPGLGETTSGSYLKNADGLTGYLDVSLDDIYTSDATVHPYILHFDDYSAGNFDPLSPTGFTSVTDPPPSGNLVMAMGCDYDYQDYVFDLDGLGAVDFIIAVGCTYAVSSASKSQRFAPEYRLPQHNKKAASEVSVEIVTNDLKGGDAASEATLQVKVVDLNHAIPVGTGLNEMRADSSVGGISVEVPSVTTGVVSFPTTPISGTGHDPLDPLIFEGVIANSSAAPEGNYSGLVKVTDSYLPGQNEAPLLNGMDGITRVDPVENPLAGLFEISEFATYQAFDIEVITGAELILITPNGGENWVVSTNEEITWVPDGVVGTVFLEYSKDNFVADVNTIEVDEDNDGSFMWVDIPDDPSDTVRVRVSSTDSPSVNDVSDADFRIWKYEIVFSDEGVLPEMVSTWDDISPALCIETDGDIKMAYNVNKVIANDRAYSYACKSMDGLTWVEFTPSFQSGGGVLANHGDNTKIIADNTGNSFRYLSLYYVAYDSWSTPFAAATERFPSPWGIDGAHVTVYISRASEMIMDADEYVYVMGDRNNQLQFKKSEIPGHLTGGPSGAVWSNFPIYYIDQGYFSRARSIELAPDDNMYFVYYVNDSANQIKLAYSTDSTGLIWDTSTTVYDGSPTGTTGAHDPGLDIDPDGGFHVTFVRESGVNNQLCYVHSTDGTSWSSPVVISDMAVEFNEDPICFYEWNSFDMLATVWKGGAHIYVSVSMDDGQTWFDAVQVDSLLPDNMQPDFIVTSDGIMHIAWAAINGTHKDIHFRNAWIEET